MPMICNFLKLVQKLHIMLNKHSKNRQKLFNERYNPAKLIQKMNLQALKLGQKINYKTNLDNQVITKIMIKMGAPVESNYLIINV